MNENRRFKCRVCDNIRDVNIWEEIAYPHLFGVLVFIKCPKCDKLHWHTRAKDTK